MTKADLPGAPQGYPDTGGPTRPQGIPEPGDVPMIAELYEADTFTDTQLDAGELEAGGATADPGVMNDPLLSRALRADETSDPIVAAQEGIPYVPPIDPVTSGTQEDGDPIIASGFSTSAFSESYDESHHSGYEMDEDEVTERIRDALRGDAQTTAYAETIEIAVLGGQATVAGVVEDLDDADAVLAVAERATGITEVVDQLEVASLNERGTDPRGREATS